MKALARSRRDDAETEGPFRGPEQLSLAMPLVSVVGLMIVVSAAVTGLPAQIVAICAVGGFGLTALAPMALMESFVGRPLRTALAQLRAARDGEEAPAARAATGVVADLVAIARDIRAGRSGLAEHRAALSQAEKLAAAGDEAIRAFRLQSEELAESTVQSESLIKRAAQSQLAEIAEALRALKAATPTAQSEAALERIEQMLVYLAETLERRDSRAQQTEGAVGRVETALRDIARQIGREAEAIQAGVSSAALMLRNDLAATVAEDKSARARQTERLETFEGRVLTKLADIAPTDSARLTEVIRAESEATRRSLRERIEQLLEKAGEAAFDAGRMEAFVAAVEPRLAAIDRVAEGALPSLQNAIEAVAARIETTAARTDADPLREELSRLAEATARIGDEVALARGGDDIAILRADIQSAAAELGVSIAALAKRPESPSRDAAIAPELERLASAVARIGDELTGLRVADGEFETIRSEVRKSAGELGSTVAALGAALESSPRLDEIATTCGSFAETLQKHAEGLEARLVERLSVEGRETETRRFESLARMADRLCNAIERLDVLAAAATEAAAVEDKTLETQQRALAEDLASWGVRLETALAERVGPLAETVAGRADVAALAAQLGEGFDALAARVDAGAQSLASEAERLESARGTIDRALAALTETHGQLRDAALRIDAELTSQTEAGQTNIAAGEQLRDTCKRLEAFAAGVLSQARDTFDDAQTRLAALAPQFADSATRLTALEARDAHELAELQAATEAATQAFVARLDSLASFVQPIASFNQDKLTSEMEFRLRVCNQDLAERADFTGERKRLEEIAEQFAATLAPLAEAAARAQAAANEQTGEALTRLGALAGETLTQSRDQLADIHARFAKLAPRFDSCATALTALSERENSELVALQATTQASAQALGARLDTLATVLQPLVKFDAAALAAELGSRFETCSQELIGKADFQGVQRRLEQAAAEIETRVAAQAEAAAYAHSAADEHAREAVSELRAQAENELGRARDALTAAETRLTALSLQLIGSAGALTTLSERDQSEVAALHAVAQALAARLDTLAVQIEGRGSADLAAFSADIAMRFDTFAEAQTARTEALEMRLAGRANTLDRTSVASALTVFRAMTRQLGEAKTCFEDAAEAFANRTAAASASETALPSEFSARFDAFAEGLASRIEALDLRLSAHASRQNRTEIAAALTAFRAMMRNMAGGIARIEAAGATLEAGAAAQPTVREAQDASRAAYEAATGALATLDSRFAHLAEAQTRGLERLELRISEQKSGLDRTAVASALTVFRTLSHELGETLTTFRASEETNKPTIPAHNDMERWDAFARTLNDRFDALELRLAARGAAVDRTALASALTAFRGLGGALSRAIETVESAAGALQSSRNDNQSEMREDVRALACELAEIGGRLDVIASAQTEGLPNPIQPTVGGDPAIVETLRGELRAIAVDVSDSLARFASRWEENTPPPPFVSFEPAWREAQDGRDAQLVEALAGIERRLSALAANIRPSQEFAAAPDLSSPAAVARLVTSLADSLDFRFTEIERSLADLSSQLGTRDGDSVDAAFDETLLVLTKQVNSAVEVLKSGLSDFVGVSAALVEDIDARKQRVVANKI